jgi:hypothetical protein
MPEESRRGCKNSGVIMNGSYSASQEIVFRSRRKVGGCILFANAPGLLILRAERQSEVDQHATDHTNC